MVMVLHKFALLGGKVPAAAGMRAAGRPPKAGRRTSFAAPAAPKTLPPTGRSSFRLIFYRKVFAFCGLCFFADFALFAAGTERIARPPQGQANGSILSTLAACRFWAFAVGKNSPHPPQRKAIGSFLSTLAVCRFWGLQWGRIVPIPARANQLDRFYPPLPPVDFGPLQWGRIVPIPARARQTDGFFIPYRPVLPTAG